MFTIKIMNYTFPQIEQDGSCKIKLDEPELSSVYLREWQSVEVWYPASQNFKDKVEELKQEAYNDYHDDLAGEEKTGEELELIIEMQAEYKAFVTYVDNDGEDSFYCIAPYEEVYITDSNGKTVHLIK